ncbi:somatostatin receptor type 1-like [Mya arenaria]|uniref:somatostatin receptor type 1-like n=1 Tax=Mya arenaria TaxID=6604 RepID=UPI0022E2F26A|nr:somatostatin receptor type 1-like [Mya arenaria]
MIQMADDYLAHLAGNINGLSDLNQTIIQGDGCVNSSINQSSEIPFFMDDPIYQATLKVEKYTLPVICVFGLLGNTLSSITFLKLPLRRAPCSLYLAVRGFSDNGFLLSLLLPWISSTFDLHLSQVKGVCQTIIFISYVCGCVSVWLCVFITFENFLLIHNPFTAGKVCCDCISKLSTVLLVLFALALYSISLRIMNGDCSPNQDLTELTQIFVYTDSLLTLVIPTVVISVLMAVIAYKVIHILQIRKIHSKLSKVIIRDNPSATVQKRILPIAKVTRMLFVVSFVFFALNVPSHVVRLRILIGTFTKGHSTTSVTMATIQSAFQILYYLSFSINVIVYATFGSNFRLVFRKIFCGYVLPTTSSQVQTEAINLVVQRRRRSMTENPSCAEARPIVSECDRSCHKS